MDFGVGAEVQSDCGCLAGSFDDLPPLPSEDAVSRRPALYSCPSGKRAQLLKSKNWHLLLQKTPEGDAVRNGRKPACELFFVP